MNTHTVGVVYNGVQAQPWSDRKKVYYYLTTDSSIRVGDHVVTSPPAGLQICEVKEVYHNTKLDSAAKYIVQKVDDTEYKTAERRSRMLAQAKKDISEQIARLRIRRDKVEAQIKKEMLRKWLEQDTTWCKIGDSIQELERALEMLNDPTVDPEMVSSIVVAVEIR